METGSKRFSETEVGKIPICENGEILEFEENENVNFSPSPSTRIVVRGSFEDEVPVLVPLGLPKVTRALS